MKQYFFSCCNNHLLSALFYRCSVKKLRASRAALNIFCVSHRISYFKLKHVRFPVAKKVYVKSLEISMHMV